MANAKITSPAFARSPRKPNHAELDELNNWVRDNIGKQPDILGNAYITVFDHYSTDSPGYNGKLMYVIWGASPEYCSIFLWPNGQLRHHSCHDDACEDRRHYYRALAGSRQRFLKSLPFSSQNHDDHENVLDVGIWECSTNICEMQHAGLCDTTACIYYGCPSDPVTYFCPRHWYEMHYGERAPYRLLEHPKDKCN